MNSQLLIGSAIALSFSRDVPLRAREPNKPSIIGLAGRMGSGKDLATEVLKKHGYHARSFAWPLRREVEEMLRSKEEWMSLLPEIARDIKEASRAEVWDKPTSERMRRILQYWGGEFRRSQDEDYWVKNLEGRMRTHPHYVISDVRYPNEVSMIRKKGGVIWWIDRESEITGIPNHASEQLQAADCDFVLDNRGTKEDLEYSVQTMLSLLSRAA